jgi:hypothetical protein
MIGLMMDYPLRKQGFYGKGRPLEMDEAPTLREYKKDLMMK